MTPSKPRSRGLAPTDVVGEVMKCAICGRVLDVAASRLDGADAPIVVEGYQHTYADRLAGVEDDHAPVPVPVGDIEGTPRCDFCSNDLRPAKRDSTGVIIEPGEGWRLPTQASRIEVDHLIPTNDPELRQRVAKAIESDSGIATTYDEDWCACDTCADLIRAGKWMRLARRAADAGAERQGWVGPEYEEARMLGREAIWRMYASLRDTVSGPLEPFYDRVTRRENPSAE